MSPRIATSAHPGLRHPAGSPQRKQGTWNLACAAGSPQDRCLNLNRRQYNAPAQRGHIRFGFRPVDENDTPRNGRWPGMMLRG